MITHTSCGHQAPLATLRYYPLESKVTVGVKPNGRLYDREPHRVTQIYRRVGTPVTKPHLYCNSCDSFFPLKDFSLVYACQYCNSTDLRHTMNTPECTTFANVDLVCEKCVVNICMGKCGRKCYDFSYAHEKFGRTLDKLYKKYLKDGELS